MIIALCCTKNWYQYLLVDIYALLNTNKIKKIYLFIENDKIDELENFKEFNTEFIIYNYHKITNYISENNPNKKTIFTEAALIRLFFSKYIKEDKVIYLDTDAIVLSSIDTLWQIDLNNYYIAGVKDNSIMDYIDYLDYLNLNESTYVNSGVLLINLQKIRDDKIDTKFINLLNKGKYRFPDQDIINIGCQNHILLIDNMYNSSYATGFSENIKIIHYTHKKTNWLKNREYSELWYNWERRYQNYLTSAQKDSKLQIDLIIPVYNTNKFLSRALDSISNQSIKDQILITVIDDGSNEDVNSILAKYKQLLNINYHRFNKNKGVGKAREWGMENTSLPFLTFLDSDDTFYDEYAIEKMYNVIKNNPKCSVVIGKEKNKNYETLIYSHVYGKMYRREKINNEKIHFPSTRTQEDVIFNYKLFSKLKDEEIEIINDVIVEYRSDNINSLTKSYNTYLEFIKNLKNMIQITKTKKINSNYAIILLKDYVNYEKIYKFSTEKERVEYYKLVNKYYQKIKPSIEAKIKNEAGKYLEIIRFIKYISKF